MFFLKHGVDATKAVDRANLCKLFRLLMQRNIPASYLRLLLNLYTNSVACVSRNGIRSPQFLIQNGVKQGWHHKVLFYFVCI